MLIVQNWSEYLFNKIDFVHISFCLLRISIFWFCLFIFYHKSNQQFTHLSKSFVKIEMTNSKTGRLAKKASHADHALAREKAKVKAKECI